MAKKRTGKPDNVTEAGAVELDEDALGAVAAGGEAVAKIPLPPAPFVATPLPPINPADETATLLGHEITHVRQTEGRAQKEN